jgi:hypothetical protein
MIWVSLLLFVGEKKRFSYALRVLNLNFIIENAINSSDQVKLGELWLNINKKSKGNTPNGFFKAKNSIFIRVYQ